MSAVRLKLGLMNVDKTFYMGGKSRVCSDFVAGRYSFMNYGCDICPNVKAGAYVMFAPGVIITGSDHRIDQPSVPMYFTKRPDVPETKIGDDVWLGARSIVMAGVEIGRGSVIAAGAVVTKDVAEYSIVAGVPAKFVRMRFENKEEQNIHNEMLNQKTKHWDYCDPIE